MGKVSRAVFGSPLFMICGLCGENESGHRFTIFFSKILDFTWKSSRTLHWRKKPTFTIQKHDFKSPISYNLVIIRTI